MVNDLQVNTTKPKLSLMTADFCLLSCFLTANTSLFDWGPEFSVQWITSTPDQYSRLSAVVGWPGLLTGPRTGMQLLPAQRWHCLFVV